MNLDLYNFESSDAEYCRYILTSPRSLEACTRLAVKPAELLHKSLNEIIEEDNALSSITHLQNGYEIREKQRLDLLKKCRQIREKIILEQKETSQRSISRLTRYKEIHRESTTCTDGKDSDEQAEQGVNHQSILLLEEDDAQQMEQKRTTEEEKEIELSSKLIQMERLKQKRVKASHQFQEQKYKSITVQNNTEEKIRRHHLLLKQKEQCHRKKRQEKTLRDYEQETDNYQQAIEKYQLLKLNKACEQRQRELECKQTESKKKNFKKAVFNRARKSCIDEQLRENQKMLQENIVLRQLSMDQVYRNQSWQKTQQITMNKQKETKRKLKTQQTQKQFNDDLQDWQAELTHYTNRAQQRAVVQSQWTAEQKALRVHETRVAREKNQKDLMKKVQEDDALYRQYLSNQIAAKDARCKIFVEQREETKQLLRKAAQQSSQSADNMKHHRSSSFNKLVNDAEFKSQVGAGPQLARKNVSSLWLA